MNVMLRPGWTMEQFLEWEERQPNQYEFDGKNVIEMNGSTVRHQIICGNLHFLLRSGLAGSGRLVLLPTQVRTATTVRYPDLAVSCAAHSGGQRHVTDPVILFEVTSASTELTDLTKKLEEYTGLSSLQRYAVLSQAEMLVLLFVRSGDRWEMQKLRDGALHLPEIDLALGLVDIYEGVSFDDEP